MKQDKLGNNEMVTTVEQDTIGPPGDVFYWDKEITTISGTVPSYHPGYTHFI